MPRNPHEHHWTITRRYTKRGTRWEVRCSDCPAHLKAEERGRRYHTTPPNIVDVLLLFTAPDGALSPE